MIIPAGYFFFYVLILLNVIKMKKIFLIFLLLITLKVKASAYIVMDTDNNRVIEEIISIVLI